MWHVYVALHVYWWHLQPCAAGMRGAEGQAWMLLARFMHRSGVRLFVALLAGCFAVFGLRSALHLWVAGSARLLPVAMLPDAAGLWNGIPIDPE